MNRCKQNVIGLFLVGIVCLLLVQLRGQEAEAPALEDKKDIPITFLQWGELPFDSIYLGDGGDVLLDLKEGRRTASYALAESATMQLFAKVPGEADSEEFRLVGQADASTDDRTLFMVSAAPKESELPLSIRVIEDSLGNFPAGSFKIINFSSFWLKATIGGLEQDLESGTSKVMRPDRSNNKNLVSMILFNEKGKAVFGRRILGQARDRKLLIVEDNESGKLLVKVRNVPHIVSEKLEQEEIALFAEEAP